MHRWVAVGRLAGGRGGDLDAPSAARRALLKTGALLGRLETPRRARRRAPSGGAVHRALAAPLGGFEGHGERGKRAQLLLRLGGAEKTSRC